ncbi:MAG: hypothetical protein Q8880_00330, partial [Bacteroidota bacterium]|nr:hypothetical protein [Bacteroidota bacterium]
MKSQLFFLIFLLFSLSKIKAENFPNDSNNVETQEKFNHFMTGIDWSSCSIFYGKKNQNEKDQYSLTYYLIYQTKSNINASLSTVSIFGGGKFIDEYELGLGYLFKFFDKKLVNSINITKYIYADSIQVQSNIKADLNYFIKFKNDILIPKVMFDYYYEDGGNDYLVTYQ